MRSVSRILVVAALCALASAAMAEDARALFARGKHLYAQVNLHPDEKRAQLYAANFLQAGLIPAGSEIEVLSLNDKHFEFALVSSGKVYDYANHQQANEDFKAHLARVFGPSWDSSVLVNLGAKDREGVETGTVCVGMSREAVILALGYPPRLENPSLKADSWKYWRSRFDTMVVSFGDDDMVSGIRD